GSALSAGLSKARSAISLGFAGSRTFRRASSVIVLGLLLAGTIAIPVSANVGTVQITAQTPNPVAAGSNANFPVTVTNTSTGAGGHMFAVTGVSGATGISVVSNGCVSIANGTTAALGTV